jgi:hypothetical protein
MAKQDINIGSGVNKGDGDVLREALRKTNENFTELYDALSIASGTGSFLALSDTPASYPAVLVDPVTQQPLVTKQVLTLNANGDGIEFTSEIDPDQITGITTVATSGDYNDLINTPTLHPVAVNGQYSALSGTPTLATVALSASYNDLTDRPSLSQVAVSGQYYDLLNRPTIPSTLLDLISDGQTGEVLTTDGNGNFSWTAVGSSIDFNSVTNKPTTILGYGITDAFDGDYNSLSNKPTLFNGAFGSLSGVPTTIAGYGITDAFDGAFGSLSGIPTTVAGYGITDAFDGDYNSLSNQPTIPTAVSELSNDSNFISSISQTDVTTALGYTPYNATNPDGYITGITSSDVTTALGYTPSNFDGDYNNLTNKPTTYDEILDLTDVDNSSIAVGNVLVYRNIGGNNVWKTEPLDVQDLGNVTTTGLANGSILSYNAFSTSWEISQTTFIDGVMNLPILASEPSSPTDGMVAIASGEAGEWNPGGLADGTKQMVVYLGGWRAIASGGGA